MTAAEERWDVVVVGLHDPQSTGALTTKLGSLCGMPPAQIRAALDEGEFAVHAGLHRRDAERAAEELDRLGAAVDLRLAAPSGPMLKPDADRNVGASVGGFISDSAAPPRFANSGVRDIPLEPDPEGGPISAPRVPPPPNLGIGSPSRPVVPQAPPMGGERMFGLEASADEAPLVPPPPSRDLLPPSPAFGANPLGLGAPPRASTPELITAPRVTPIPEPMPGLGGGDPLSALSTELDKIGDGSLDSLLGTIDGSEPVKGKPNEPARPREFDRVATRPSAAQRQAARDARAKAKAEESGDAIPTREPSAKLEPAGGLAAAVEPEPAAPPPKKKKKKKKTTSQQPIVDDALQLDLKAAGLAESYVGGVLANEARVAGQSAVRAREVAGSGVMPTVVPPEALEGRPLLGPDRLTAGLFAAAIGLGLSLVVTVILHRGIEENAVVGLEAELEEALINPGKVVSGELRATGAVEEDLADEYGGIQRMFILKWLAIAAPLGYVLARLNRSR